MLSAKHNLRPFYLFGCFLLLLVLLLTPQSLLFFRAGSCGVGWSAAPVCAAFYGRDKPIRAGYQITRRHALVLENTYDLVTGILVKMCGSHIFETLQNGKYCAVGVDLELYKHNNQKNMEDHQRKIRDAQEAYKKGLQEIAK